MIGPETREQRQIRYLEIERDSLRRELAVRAADIAKLEQMISYAHAERDELVGRFDMALLSICLQHCTLTARVAVAMGAMFQGAWT